MVKINIDIPNSFGVCSGHEMDFTCTSLKERNEVMESFLRPDLLI